MKKQSTLFLISLLGMLLSSCGEVKYTDISEEEFNSYFTEEKAAKAKEDIEALSTFTFIMGQNGNGFEYNVNTFVDVNYYYEYGKLYVGPNHKDNEEGEFLYIITDSTNADYYENKIGEEKVHESGADVYEDYLESVSNVKDTILRALTSPTYLLSQYGYKEGYKYFKGSDNSIKVSAEVTLEDQTLVGYATYDVTTLYPKSFSAQIYEEAAIYTITFSFEANPKIKRKTPQDLGF